MGYNFFCPNCQQLFELSEGQTVECPVCHGPMKWSAPKETIKPNLQPPTSKKRTPWMIIGGIALVIVAYGTWTMLSNLQNNPTTVPELARSIPSKATVSHAGKVVAWGSNEYGQSVVPTGLDNVIAVAAGTGHNLVLKADGTVFAWGLNNKWQCDVPNGLSGVIAVAAGQSHSLALTKDGTVVAWGDMDFGQCAVPVGLKDVTAITAGRHHSLAVKKDGSVVAWGYNKEGQCNVPDGLKGVVAIAADFHNLALKADGTVVAWGLNNRGQCDVPAGLKGVVAVAAGVYTSLVVKKDGTVVVWKNGDPNVPCAAPDGLADVQVISACSVNNLALKKDGTVVAWGANNKGENDIPRGLSSVIAIAAGSSHNLAIVPPDLLVRAETLTLGGGMVFVRPEGGDYNLRIDANVPWTATISEPLFTHWLRLSPESGEGSGSVKITYDKNYGEERTAVISVSGRGVPSQQFKVQQGKAWNYTGGGGSSAPQIRGQPRGAVQPAGQQRGGGVRDGREEQTEMQPTGQGRGRGSTSRTSDSQSTRSEGLAPSLIPRNDDSVYYFNTTYILVEDAYRIWWTDYSGNFYIDPNGTAWIQKEELTKCMDNVRSIYYHWKAYFFLLTNNELWAMGKNDDGRLGDDTGLDKSSPVLIMRDVANLYFDNATVYALKTDKSRWGWGYGIKGGKTAFAPIKVDDYFNHNQQLLADHISMQNGNQEIHTSIPLTDEIVALLGGKENIVTSIESEKSRYYAITKDGVLWGWGYNNGALGDGTKADREKPVKIAEDAKRLLPNFFITQSNDWYCYSREDSKPKFTPQIALKNVLYALSLNRGNSGGLWCTPDGKLWSSGHSDSAQFDGKILSNIKIPSIVRAQDGQVIVPRLEQTGGRR